MSKDVIPSLLPEIASSMGRDDTPRGFGQRYIKRVPVGEREGVTARGDTARPTEGNEEGHEGGEGRGERT